MAVQSSQSQPGQFRAAVAAAQAGYGRGGGDRSFRNSHDDQHAEAADRLDNHGRRLAALEDPGAGSYEPNPPADYEGH